MTLSLLLILILALFVIPAVLLPQNRIRFFSLSAAVPFFVLFLLFIISLFVESQIMEDKIGTVFSICFPFLKNNPELSREEMTHLVSWFVYLIGYLFLYLIFFLIFHHTYVGSNPSIHKPTKIILRFFDTFSFLIVTFVPLFLFLVNIRQVLILQDGLFKGLFDILYHIGA